MNINFNYVEFRKIKPGDTFIHVIDSELDIYMKITNHRDPESKWNAVRLEDGVVTHFPDNDLVYPLEKSTFNI